MGLWQRGRVTLVWSDKHELHGLEVIMRRRPLGDITGAWMSEPDEGLPGWDDLTPKERAERTEGYAAELASLIVGWNLADDDGNPVPTTTEGLLRHCDQAMINQMRDAYTDRTTKVAPPLPLPSDGGEPPGEWDLPPQEVTTPETLAA